MNISLALIVPSPHPIRSSWDDDKMNELAQSLREQGLIQPIKVRPVNGVYEIVYGHRRVEAARRAGFTEIDATIEEVDDTGTMIQALIENVQREDMAPLDTARALKALKEMTGWSNMDIERRGIMLNSRVSEYLSLLNQPDAIKKLLSSDESSITPRHIRETSSFIADESVKLAILQKADEEQLSAAQTRQIAEAVAAAPSDHARQVLINTPLGSVLHDPEFVRERAAQFGAHDPLYKTPRSTLNEDWQNTPEVANWLRLLKDFSTAIESAQQAETLGKFAPEARGFIARRIRKIAETLNEWASALEDE